MVAVYSPSLLIFVYCSSNKPKLYYIVVLLKFQQCKNRAPCVARPMPWHWMINMIVVWPVWALNTM